MTKPVSGPVLAYPAAAPPASSRRAALDALFAAHGLALAPAPASAGPGPVLRVIDSRTGRPPARLPEAVERQLAVWVDGRDDSAVA